MKLVESAHPAIKSIIVKPNPGGSGIKNNGFSGGEGRISVEQAENLVRLNTRRRGRKAGYDKLIRSNCNGQQLSHPKNRGARGFDDPAIQHRDGGAGLPGL